MCHIIHMLTVSVCLQHAHIYGYTFFFPCCMETFVFSKLSFLYRNKPNMVNAPEGLNQVRFLPKRFLAISQEIILVEPVLR